MADYQLDGRRGCKATEDSGALKVYIEEGPQQVIAATAAVTLDAADHGAIYTNEGAGGAASLRALTLPAAAAGRKFSFYDQNGSGLRVLAAGTNTIRLGPGAANLSKAGGYVESQFQGQFLTLVAVNATEWIAAAPAANWTVENS